MNISDIFKYIISIGLIYIVLDNYGNDIINTIKLVNINYIIIIFLISFAQYLLSAYRWMYISKHTDLNISFGSSIRFYYISTFMNNILPGGIVGDIFRIYYHADNKMEFLQIGKAFQSVIFERLSGQIMLLSFFITSLSLYFVLNEKYIAFFYLFILLIIVFFSFKYLFKLKVKKFLKYI